MSLSAGLRRRDPDLLDRLIEQHQHRLLRYLVSVTGDGALVSDLFQDTWLRVLERGHLYDGRARFAAWLLTCGVGLGVEDPREGRHHPVSGSG